MHLQRSPGSTRPTYDYEYSMDIIKNKLGNKIHKNYTGDAKVKDNIDTEEDDERDIEKFNNDGVSISQIQYEGDCYE